MMVKLSSTLTLVLILHALMVRVLLVILFMELTRPLVDKCLFKIFRFGKLLVPFDLHAFNIINLNY